MKEEMSVPVKKQVVWTAVSNLGETDHPYMSGVFEPNLEEVNAPVLPVLEGKIPSDVDGVYIRNTEQPTMKPLGNYHPFDGDGMIHQISLDGRGNCSYRNRYIRTDGFLAEQEAKKALWVGVSERKIERDRPGWGAEGYLKDTSATDVVVHNGRVLTMFYRCGEAYRLDPETLENLGKDNYNGNFPSDGFSAHAKSDENTGELLFFNYSAKAPFMHYGVVNSSNDIVNYTEIPIGAPKLPHDMAFTENYSILSDLAIQFDENQLAEGKFKNVISKKPSRFAIIPRYGGRKDVRFFQVKTTFVLHFLNAYEVKDPSTGHELIIMDGYRQCVFDRIPNPQSKETMTSWKKEVPEKYHKIFPTLGGMDTSITKLWRWKFDLTSGKTLWEGPMDDISNRLTEFGVFNQRYAGRPYRYAYSCLLKPGWLLFTGVVKHDLEQGTSLCYKFEEGRYCSEPAFAPRKQPKSEDDGYLVTFVTDMNKNQSECVLFDALKLESGPVCSLLLPHKISGGTHACWASRTHINRSKL